jgi:hypothetical protein
VKIFIGEQADKDFLRRCIAETGPLDIVIDDGGHRSGQQIASFEAIYPTMSERGVYLVEDTHVNYWEMAYDLPRDESFIAFAKARVDDLHAWHWNPDNYERYRHPPEKRSGEVAVPAFTRSTDCITFYDSIVVFERRKAPEPRHWSQPLQIHQIRNRQTIKVFEPLPDPSSRSVTEKS